jgi:hypothetical protein
MMTSSTIPSLRQGKFANIHAVCWAPGRWATDSAMEIVILRLFVSPKGERAPPASPSWRDDMFWFMMSEI